MGGKRIRDECVLMPCQWYPANILRIHNIISSIIYERLD